jgi:hypothetical protein
MATSGTTAFALDLGELIEEAFERAGLESRSGNDYRTARRSLNLMAIDWSNRGINLWTVEQGTVALTEGTATYNLPADTVDLLETSIRTTTNGVATDIRIPRISVSTYAGITNKALQGRPNEVWVDRQTTPRVHVWPVPSSDDYTLVYYRMRRIQDAGATAAATPDIPYRFIPAMVAGLAYYIAQKKPESEARIPRLKTEYEELFNTAATEDHERASWRIVPGV